MSSLWYPQTTETEAERRVREARERAAHERGGLSTWAQQQVVHILAERMQQQIVVAHAALLEARTAATQLLELVPRDPDNPLWHGAHYVDYILNPTTFLSSLDEMTKAAERALAESEARRRL